jgi:hypothetical protein
MSKQQEVLAAIQSPVIRTNLLRGRKAPFLLAYRKLVSDGQVVEHGSGGLGDPVYAGLPGASFPVPRYVGGVRPADLALLVRAGLSEEYARQRLEEAIASPGDNTAALVEQLELAKAVIEANGDDPDELIPLPHDRGRPIDTFINPLMPMPPEFKEDTDV